VSFRFSPAVLAAIKRRDGIPISEQVRRALDTWITANTSAAANTSRRRRA